MVSKANYLRAPWGPRLESVEQIRDRTVRFASAARKIHPSLKNWFHLGSSKAKALSRPCNMLDPSEVLALIERGRAMTDSKPRIPLENGWYSFSVWNGLDNDCSVGWQASCGGTSEWVNNSVVLDWNSGSALGSDLGTATRLLELIAVCWEPEYGVVADSFIPKDPKGYRLVQDDSIPELGWILYLNNRHIKKSDVPAAFDVRPAGPNGTLIVAGEQPVLRGNAKGSQLLEQIREQLGLPPSYRLEKE